MSSGASKIKLLPVTKKLKEDGSRPVLTLYNSKDKDTKPLILGRNDATGITEKRCSREHLTVKYDSVSQEIVLTQCGSNPSSVQYGDTSHVLSKHDVKRVPVAQCYSQDNQCIIYLVHKDSLYGYSVIAKKLKQTVEHDKPTDSKPSLSKDEVAASSVSSKKSVNGADSRKRKTGTLDDFVNKKAKTETASSSSASSDMSGEWTEPDPKLYVYKCLGLKSSSKIAGFDMDSTLIVSKSGAKWPKDKDDWKFMFPSVPTKLKQLHADGYKIVIFTNQGGIATGTVKAADIQHKIEMVIKAVGIPIQALIAACKKGVYRKPSPGMWNYVVDKGNEGVAADLDTSVYVGDAAGRPAGWQPGKKKDFACSDRLFALNIGVKFATPEAFFKGETEAKYDMPEFSPQEALKVKDRVSPPSNKLVSGSQELVLMVGFPGSGKSYFSTNHLSGYERVNRDTLGNWQKCVARCEQVLKDGKSVVVDNTNPDQESRARYIQVAKKLKVPVRCFLMSTTYKQARHNEVYRQLTDSKHKPISDMVVNSYKSKYCEPSISEGFTDVVKANVVLKFDSEANKKLYSLYLLDK